jgi:hypothetical protein
VGESVALGEAAGADADAEALGTGDAYGLVVG